MATFCSTQTRQAPTQCVAAWRGISSRNRCAPIRRRKQCSHVRAGVFHWTPEGRRLYDFSSGVLVANLGHNPVAWMQRFMKHMGWPTTPLSTSSGFFPALPMNAYNAVTSRGN